MLNAQFPKIYVGTAGRVGGHEGFLVIQTPRIKTDILAKSPRNYKAELDLELSIVLWEQENITEQLEEKAAAIYQQFENDCFLGGLARDSRLEETRFIFDDSSEQTLGICEIDYKVFYDLEGKKSHQIYSLWK
jgi:hypothetical protein